MRGGDEQPEGASASLGRERARHVLALLDVEVKMATLRALVQLGIVSTEPSINGAGPRRGQDLEPDHDRLPDSVREAGTIGPSARCSAGGIARRAYWASFHVCPRE